MLMVKRRAARSRWSGLGQRVVVGAASVAVLGCLAVAAGGRIDAQTLRFCGGQSAPPQSVPYTCRTQILTIDGSQVSAVLHADGQAVTVTYTLVAPRTSDAPIRVTHHIGVSGGGGPRSVANGVIPAGQTTATLSVTTPCFAGQVDIKFVFVLDTQPEGRVGGPWIQNGTPPCTPPTTPPITPASSPPTTPASSPPSTPPPSTTTAAPIFVGAVGTTCQKDVPVIGIEMGDRADLDGRVGTLTFIDLNGKVIDVRPFTYEAGGTHTELYPGASVDPVTGEATDWPGWMQNAFGFWVEDPSDALWRQGLTLVVSVNPTASASISYPPASSACASPPTALQQGVGTTLPVTGSNGRDAYSVALVAVMIGSLLVVIAGARRVAAHRGDD
jgi:hypothetical protein